jgi:hypothetical protein
MVHTIGVLAVHTTDVLTVHTIDVLTMYTIDVLTMHTIDVLIMHIIDVLTMHKIDLSSSSVPLSLTFSSKYRSEKYSNLSLLLQEPKVYVFPLILKTEFQAIENHQIDF